MPETPETGPSRTPRDAGKPAEPAVADQPATSLNDPRVNDFAAMHGMSRIRHGYTQIAPVLMPYFTSPIHDDVRGIMVGYGNPPESGPAAVVYVLSTSLGMVGLIASMVGGVFVGVVVLVLGGSTTLGFAVGAIGAVATLVALSWWAARAIRTTQAALSVMFPSPGEEQAGDDQ